MSPTARLWSPRMAGLLLVLPAVAFMVGFYVLPVARLVGTSFHADGEAAFSLTAYASVLTSRRSLLAIERTLRIAIFATVIALVVAVPISLFLIGASRRMRTFVLMTTFVSLAASLIIRNYGWLVVLGDAGPINQLLIAVGILSAPARLVYSEGAILAALVHYSLPFMILPLYGALSRLEPSTWEAAQSLGGTPGSVLRTVVLPQMMPGIYVGISLVFAVGTSIFVTPIMLGSPSTAFASQIAADSFLVDLDYARGSAIVVILTIITFAALAAYTFATRKIGRANV